MRLALVANAEAGNGLPAEEIAARLGPGVRSFPLGAEDEAASSGVERLVVAGGDGSLAPAAAAAARARIELAVVPAGTGNDFARRLELPLDLDEACRLAATGTRTRRVDLGWMGERPFLNVASIGLAPAAAERASRLKRLLGRFAYAAGAVAAAATARPVRCRIVCDGDEAFAGAAWQAIVSSSGAFGGGSRVARADPSDGLLDVTVVEAGPRRRLALVAYGFRAGDAARRPDVRYRRAAEIVLELASRSAANVDGEVVETSGATFRVDPGAVSVVVP